MEFDQMDYTVATV